jgi:hypothetical protein
MLGGDLCQAVDRSDTVHEVSRGCRFCPVPGPLNGIKR